MSRTQDKEHEHELCRALTGVDEVSARLSDSVLTRTRTRFGPAPVDELMETFGAGGLDAVARDDRLLKVARVITYGLYTGFLPAGIPDVDTPEGEIPAPEDHFEALVWRVIQAHAPGLSGGYYGQWHYAPEDRHE